MADQPTAASTAGGPSGRKVAREMLWFGAGQAVGQIATYALVLVLAALLSPRDFGTVAVGLVVVRLGTLVTNGGLGGEIIAAKDLTIGNVTSALRGNLKLGLTISALIALTASPLTHAFAKGGDPDVVRALGIVVTIAALSCIPEALLKKSLNFKTYSMLGASSAVLTALLALSAAFLGAGVWALAIRQIAYQSFLAVFGWRAARGVLASLPSEGAATPHPAQPRTRTAFMVVGFSVMGAMTLDNIVVGALTDAQQLGFYTLAFTLGFAPLTEISWRLGQVMFPAAAATHDLASVGARTVQALRLTALLLLPLLPLGVVLAPSLVPALLGEKWQPMVSPLQVLLCVGILQAPINMIGESLSGTGNINFRARRESVWAVTTLAAVAMFTAIDGIRGAALGHLAAFLPLAVVYIAAGSRRIGTSSRELWSSLRPVVLAVSVQSLVTLITALALGGPRSAPVAVAAAGLGLTTAVVLLWRAPSRPLGELRVILDVLRSRRSPSALSSKLQSSH